MQKREKSGPNVWLFLFMSWTLVLKTKSTVECALKF